MNSLILPDALDGLMAALLPVDATLVEDAPRHPAFSAAAVLILLFPGSRGVSFYLTARPHTLSRHPGQISLPGGRAEPGDASLWQTALRETEEELGVPPSLLVPLGRLETFHMYRSGYAITPFVAWSSDLPALVPHAAEVDEVIEVPLDALLDPSLVHQETWEYNDRDWFVTFFRFGDHQVWGATARILDDLARRIGATESRHPFRPGDVRPVERSAG